MLNLNCEKNTCNNNNNNPFLENEYFNTGLY